MAQTVKLKRSNVAGNIPTSSNLDHGELAINTADGKVYLKRNDNTIQSIVTTNTSAPISGAVNLSGSVYLTGSVQILSGSLRLRTSQDPDPSGVNNTTYLFESSSNTTLGRDLYVRQDGNLVKWKWLEGLLGTGLLYGGALYYSGSYTSSQLYIDSGSGIIVNFNATTGSEINPQITYVTWAATTQSALYVTSSTATYVYVDGAGTIHQRSTYFDESQYTGAIILGTYLHANRQNITSTINHVRTVYAVGQQFYNFAEVFGPMKESGGTLSGQSGTLRLNYSAGEVYDVGAFYQTQPNVPSRKSFDAVATASIARIYRSGSVFISDNNGGIFYTTIDPTNWDNNGVLTSLTGNDRFTIQRVFLQPTTGKIGVYYGQNTYPDLATANASVLTENFVEATYTAKQFVFLGYIIVKSNNSNLLDTATANIVQAGIFRNTIGGGGSTVSVTQLTNLSDVSITTPSNGQALVYNGGVWNNGIPLNATSASFSSTASYVNQLNQTLVVTGSILSNGVNVVDNAIAMAIALG